MSYNGFLIKVGDYTIPMNKYIKANSYSAYQNVQDLDSYVDADGFLHRNALEHIRNKVEFETPPMLDNEQMSDFLTNIRRNYINVSERKASVTLYITETDSYITQDMYMSDPKPTIYGTYGDKIHYNALRISFIGY